MRKLSLATAMLFLTVTSIGAQVPKLEMTRLRERLNLPAEVNIECVPNREVEGEVQIKFNFREKLQ